MVLCKVNNDFHQSSCSSITLYSLGLLCIIPYCWPPFLSWKWFLSFFSFFFLPDTELTWFFSHLWSLCSVALDDSSCFCLCGAVTQGSASFGGLSHPLWLASMLMISLCGMILSQDSQAYLPNCSVNVSLKYMDSPQVQYFFVKIPHLYLTP